MLSKKSRGNENVWVSFSDVMTALMVIFMFIAISYIVEVQKREAQRVRIIEEYQDTKEELYAELENEFKDDFREWQVELDKDLSIKFTNPDVLFQSGSANIRSNFKEILNEFLPRYFDILLKKKYEDKIAEIRIEGHTDAVPALDYDLDPYIGNVKLSQLRSAEVLKYFRIMDYYQSLSDDQIAKLQFWLTANGLSYGRTLDSSKELTAITGNDVNKEFSRRVEFRIVTTSENVLDEVIKDLGR